MNIPPTEQSERDLVAAALEGRRDGFTELVRRHMTSLQHFLSRHNTETDVDDLVQETFLRAYRSLDRYDPRWRFSTWLFTIARRLSLDEARRRRRPGATPNNMASDFSDVRNGPRDPVDEKQSRPDEIVESRERRRNIWNTAKTVLGEEEWTTLWLFYAEEMSVKEIARVQEKNVSAVKTMLHRARKRLAPFVSLEENPRKNESAEGVTKSLDHTKKSPTKASEVERKMNDERNSLSLPDCESGENLPCEGNAS